MKLLFKFNLIFILVMALGVAVSGYISRSLLQA
jgi:protein-histidine pros-kinase